MADPHPSSPSPFIAEALCELHVRRGDRGNDEGNDRGHDRGSDRGDAWPTDLVGDFYRVMQPYYARMEPLSDLEFEVSLTEAGLNRRVLAPKARFRFHHARRPLALHLAPGIVSVNALAPYPGWASFRSEILATWNRAVEVIRPASVARIGLRYITRIPNPSTADTPSHWLRPTGFLPNEALIHASGYSVRAEVCTDASHLTVVSLLHQPPDAALHSGAVVFDIDRILEKEIAPDPLKIGTEVDSLHEEVFRVFAEAKTDRLAHLMGA